MTIIGLVLIGFGMIISLFARAALIASVDRDLKRQSDAIPSFSAMMPNGGHMTMGEHALPHAVDSKVVAEMLKRLPVASTDSHRPIQVEVFDPKARPTGPGLSLPVEEVHRALAGETRLITVMRDGAPYRVMLKKLSGDGTTAAIAQIGYPLGEIEHLTKGLHGVLLILIPAAVATAGLSGWFLSRSALRPIGKIAKAASEVEATDLSARFPVEGSDEFAQLSETFNAMFARLGSSFDQLEKSVEQQRRFVADASHELRSPLTVVQATSSWGLTRQRPQHEYHEALTTIDEAARRMERLIGDLLTLAKADAGKLSLNLGDHSILGIVEGATHALVDEEQPTILISEIEANVSWHCDEEALVRVIGNLLQNAVRHTPPSGAVQVTIRRHTLAINDSGAGIAPEHLPHLGTRFYRVDESRTRGSGGTGLGLSICREIVTAHGWDLHFESELGRGTTVTIVRPIQSPETS